MAVVGHLVRAVGPYDLAKAVLVNVGPGFGWPGSEERRPVEGALSLAGARVASVGAQGVDGETPLGKEAEGIVHRRGQNGLVGPGTVDRSALG